MKSAYELLIERLAKQSHLDSVTDEQKKAIAEIDKRYSSKSAEREVFLRSKNTKAMSNGEFEKSQQPQEEFYRNIRSLKSSIEPEKKISEIQNNLL